MTTHPIVLKTFRPRMKAQRLPPPVGGLNTRDPLPGMDPEFAIRLINWWPDVGNLETRVGYETWATGLGGFVETLMTYESSIAASRQMFAATPSAIFDVTVTGAVGPAKQTGLSNGRWSHTMFATSAGTFLFMVNGANSPRYYNGSAWTIPVISAVDPLKLDFVAVHMQRLWFIVTNSLEVWYLPVSSLAGAAVLLDVRSYCRRGGRLVAIGSWTKDGGAGMDDLLVLVTSEGEYVIFEGTDPASNFSLVGIFQGPRPIGRRCLFKLGADLAVLTEDGLLSLDQMLPVAEGAVRRLALTDNIGPSLRALIVTSSQLFGWQLSDYPGKNMLFMNVPLDERLIQKQYVMNTRTGAWAEFEGILAGCWGRMAAYAFFGGNDGSVYRFGSSLDDAGEPINCLLQTAYSDFGSPGWKHFHMARPLFNGPAGERSPFIHIKVDYDTTPESAGSAAYDDTGGTPWDTVLWDTAPWGALGAVAPIVEAQGLGNVGLCGSIAFGVSVDNTTLKLNGIEVAYEDGAWL